MADIFQKRMEQILKNGSLGGKFVEDSNTIEDITFSNDVNYRNGALYDWDLKELDYVDFKFEKVKTYGAEGTEVEYMVRFKPNYNPEFLYKNNYYRKDGKERFGFYIDVPDLSKQTIDKWLIVGKDDRVAFDRYNVIKCNWCFEWVADNNYYRAIGCIRDSAKTVISTDVENTLGGTVVNGELSIMLPTNKDTQTITLGTRFIITDNPTRNPQTYEVVGIKDTTPLGIMNVYLKRSLFNAHVDYCGMILDDDKTEFVFDKPINDLPTGFGGKYHMICDCIQSKSLPDIEIPDNVQWKLDCDAKYLYVNGQSVQVNAITSLETTQACQWHIFIDNVEYNVVDLKDYFNISINDKQLTISAISKNMIKYIVKIAIYDDTQSYYDFVELEVKA